MNKVLHSSLFICFFCSNVVFAQSGQWVWINGSNLQNGIAVYGTQGLPSPSNTPAATYEPCEWTEMSGNFWMYGGEMAGSELWQYYPLTNEWAWMSTGTTNYGVQGIPSPSNYPPSKSYGVGTWVDLNGNFWMFGGYPGYNDLWKYSPSTNIWTWMKGSDTTGQNGVYGTRGITNTLNSPGARWECVATWTDTSGNLWLFGGYSDKGMLNDLWKFNIGTNSWTWMKGSDIFNAAGKYGTLGIEDSSSTPCGRQSYSRWKDNCGNFWLFGGFDYTNKIPYNDMWRYNPASNNWTWMNGPNYGNGYGNNGSNCAGDSTTLPKPRYEDRACWTDQQGNFWLFGGGAYAGFPNYNDLWKYCVTTNKWIWQSGDSTGNPSGNWGTLGVASPSNKPSGRFGATGWTDRKGHLYLFGANLQGRYNDLWEYTIDTTCAVCPQSACSQVLPTANFSSNDTLLCSNDCINFTNLSSNGNSWQWFFQGAIDSVSTDQNPQNICYSKSGIYNVTLIATGSGGTDSLTLSDYITVHSDPITPVITQLNDTLFCSTDTSYKSYQWYADSVIIPTATDTFLVFSHGGNYNVKVTGNDGCSIAVGINVVGLKEFTVYDLQFTVFPNPAKNKVQLAVSNWQASNYKLQICNVLGQVVRQSEIKNPKSEVDVSGFPSGVYFIQLIGQKESWVRRFVKE